MAHGHTDRHDHQRTPAPPRPISTARHAALVSGALASLLLCCASNAATLQELLNLPDLNPKSFSRHFRDFQYVFMEEIQEPDAFLRAKAGDCDDYTVLASLVLGKKGYRTRMIQIRMAGLLDHAVCYVEDDKLYLDFNNRGYLIATEKAQPTLRHIASRVAHSFGANWTSASEFTYQDGVKQLVRTIVKTDSGSDAPLTPPAPAKLKVDF